VIVDEIRDPGRQRSAIRARLRALGAPRRDVSAREQPFMLATPGSAPFSRGGWLFEIKYDGIRVLASRRDDEVALYSRSGRVITARYPELAPALRALPLARFLIDGEVVAFDAEGKASFQRLQSRMGLTNPHDIERAARAVPVVAVFFDCLMLDDRDLRPLPLLARKQCLQSLLPPAGPVRYGGHVLAEGGAVFEAASRAGLEGVVAKRTDSAYVAGRSKDWVKLKCQRRQEFVIGGYTDPQGSRAHFGALHIGHYADGRLTYVCKVGGGFDDAGLERLRRALQPLRRATSPFTVGHPEGRGHHWVEPELVCEVRYTEWTDEGGLRHPIFIGLRTDKRPEECVAERLAAPRRPEDGDQRVDRPTVGRDAAPAKIAITNSTKVFWPADGYTKGDLIAYYEAVAPLILPYLRDRPLVLTRYPDGIHGKSFFQKDAPAFVPARVHTERIDSNGAERAIEYFIVNDAASLSYVINLGTIPLHVWSSRRPALDRPDWLVLDLDPKGAPFAHVVKVALALRRILDELEVPSYVKTSGATGLHILLPLGARYTHVQSRMFARLLAALGREATPAISTIARPLRARAGKVYIDFGQNGHGQTIVAPYSVRPLPGAPASCPLRWDEVGPRLDPARFTIATLPRRFRTMADPLAPVLGGAVDMAAAIARIERRLTAVGAGRSPSDSDR
jgi:bifunctional non-homologous end joining protein LigD